MIRIAIIPAAGLGTRLYPLTRSINKALLPFGEKTIIEHQLDLIVNTTIEIVYIIIREEDNFVTQIGYQYKNIKVRYIVQKRLEGLASAIMETNKYIKNEKFLLLLCDSIFTRDTILKLLYDRSDIEESVILIAKENDNIDEYGVVELGSDQQITKVCAVNSKIKSSNYIITGAYIIANSIYDIIRNLKEDETGEKNFNTALDILASRRKLKYLIVSDVYYDVGTLKKYLYSLKRKMAETVN